jgi:hypothetical protein
MLPVEKLFREKSVTSAGNIIDPKRTLIFKLSQTYPFFLHQFQFGFGPPETSSSRILVAKAKHIRLISFSCTEVPHPK